MRAKVYRSGVVEAPAERGCEAVVYLMADEHKPAGRVGRTEAIFAAPNLMGVGRWVRGNAGTHIPDIKVREITVNPEEVWVYSIDAWEAASHSQVEHLPDRGKAGFEAYWATGMTLTDWLADGTLDPSEWEVLLNPDLVLGVRPVAGKRVAAAQSNEFYARVIADALR